MTQNLKFTPAEMITKRLREGYDADYHATLYKQTLYCLGEKWGGRVPGSSAADGLFPSFPSHKVKLLAIGQSRRILNSMFISLSKVMYNEPEPEFPQVDKWMGEVRKQAFLTRYRGTGYADGSWSDQDCPMYLDGAGTGVGFKQFGAKRNPETGYTFIDSQYVPCYNVIWDRFARVPSRSRYICFVNYIPADEAIERFGKKAEDHIRQYWDGDATQYAEQVRIFEYFDLGSRDGKISPTQCTILGEMTNAPIDIEENEWGCLPESHYCHFIAPGMDRPIGGIGLQMSTQEALNDMEKFGRNLMKQVGFRLVDLDQIHPDDVKRITSGNFPENVRFTPDKDSKMPPIQNVPGAEVGAWFGMLWNILSNQYTTDSGQTDMDRGNQLESDRTLGEAQILDARSQTQGAWSDLQAQKMHTRGVEKALKMMGIGDRDLMLLDIFGQNLPVNVPGIPQSYISAFLAEPSRTVIDVQKLRRGDLERERAQRIGNLERLAQWVGMGVDPMWYLSELLKATGETDPKEALGGGPQPMQPPVTDINAAMAGGQAQPVAA